MAPEVVDLISSSPSPTGSVPQRTSASSIRTRQHEASSDVSRNYQTAVPEPDPINPPFTSSYSSPFSSDPGPGVLARDLPLEADRSRKRRRLSPIGSSTANNDAPPLTWDAPATEDTSPRSAKRGREELKDYAQKHDVSDSSDPFASSPPSKVVDRSTHAIPAVDLSGTKGDNAMARKGKIRGLDVSDVLLSSPEPLLLRNPAGPSRTVESNSPNPFQSSPGTLRSRTKQPATAAEATLDSDDPFGSSPPRKQEKQPMACTRESQREPSRKFRDFDPISSSAPEPATGRLADRNSTLKAFPNKEATIILDDSDQEVTNSSNDELPDIHNIRPALPRCAAREPIRRVQSETYATNRQKPSRKASYPRAGAEERASAREAKQRTQEAEKVAKQQEREQQKRVRALEKEKAAALAEVNKIRTDKKVSTQEMIVDLPAGLNETLRTQVETILEGLNVQHTTWQSPVPNVFKLRRKVTSRFDDDLGYWVPYPQHIVDEEHLIIIVTAAELVQLAREGLDNHVNGLNVHMPTKRLLYILEGVTPWMRKNRNARNRQFASGVRAQNPSSAVTPASQSRRRANAAPPPEPISEEAIEDAMLELQVAHGALIHHTNVPLETAQWIGHFTQHISTAPYRRQRDQSTTTAGFCMESGQVRTGDDAADTYVRMLQEVARVTQPVAYGVAAEFATVAKLVKGLEEGGQGRLETVRKCANRDGAFSDRTLGKAMSKRLWQVFLGQDETSTDI